MFFSIDPHNGLAIYDQIVRNIKFAVAGEALRSGELIPSVRELSRALTVNPNTVARAYRELQAQGIVAPVRGTGLSVTDDAPAHCRTARRQLIRERLRGVLREALDSRLEPSEVRRIVEEEFRALQEESAAAPQTEQAEL